MEFRTGQAPENCPSLFDGAVASQWTVGPEPSGDRNHVGEALLLHPPPQPRDVGVDCSGTMHDVIDRTSALHRLTHADREVGDLAALTLLASQLLGRASLQHRDGLVIATNAKIEQGREDGPLGAKDGINGIRGNTRRGSDPLDGGGRVTVLRKELFSRVQDAQASASSLLLAQAGRVRAARGLDRGDDLS